MDFAFYTDLVMIVLLIVTIIYAVILNRKLAAFRRSREDMQNFLSAFNAANERAESSIKSLKLMAEDSGERLREDIEKAQALNEDLTFMVDRGESIANRLEKAASDANSGRRGGNGGVISNASSSAGGSNAHGTGGAQRKSNMTASGNDRDDIIDDRNDVGVETRAEELAARMVRDMERGGLSDNNDQDSVLRASKPNDTYGDAGGLSGAGSAGGFTGGGSDSRSASSDGYDQDEDAGRSEAERELLAALRSVR